MNKILCALLFSSTFINAEIPTGESLLKKLQQQYEKDPQKACTNLKASNLKYIPFIDDALDKERTKLLEKQRSLELPGNKKQHAIRTCFHTSLAALCSGFGAYNLYYNNNSPHTIAYWHSIGLGLVAFLPKAITHARKWYYYDTNAANHVAIAARLKRNNDLHKNLQANKKY